MQQSETVIQVRMLDCFGFLNVESGPVPCHLELLSLDVDERCITPDERILRERDVVGECLQSYMFKYPWSKHQVPCVSVSFASGSRVSLDGWFP